MYAVTIEESIKDILSTAIGSRVCLPDYGSELHKLIDKRFDDSYRADLARYIFQALHKWEKRAKPTDLSDIKLVGNKLTFTIELDNGDKVTL